ncbi:penicillin acylase family protein [Dankookia sp. P2]|uniref:penicillin acylase family protein n=1 Tax=Dankookia sp. P2 TaxID=3423955 RepID=UPI003D675AE5
MRSTAAPGRRWRAAPSGSRCAAPRRGSSRCWRRGTARSSPAAPARCWRCAACNLAETDLSFDCLPRMARAGSVAALFEATRGWGLIDHNLVAADTAGAIGHLVRARVPRRGRENGWLPVPGWTGAHDWQGWVEAMPVVIDPPGGVIVTANNRVVADDHPDYLCTDCHPAYRARRIAERIAATGRFAPADAAALHADTLSPHAALLQARLAALPVPEDTGAAALRRGCSAGTGRWRRGRRRRRAGWRCAGR